MPQYLLHISPEQANKSPRELQDYLRGVAKKNFRRLSHQNHPDRGGENDKMVQIIEAYALARRIVWADPHLQHHKATVSISITSAGLSITGGKLMEGGWKVKPPS